MAENLIAELKHSGRFHILESYEPRFYWLPGTGKALCGTIGLFKGARKEAPQVVKQGKFICVDCIEQWNKKRKEEGNGKKE